MSDIHRRMLTKILSHKPAQQETGPQRVSAIFAEHFELQQDEARESGIELGFAARCLIPATLPYKRITESTYTRRAGDFTLSLVASPDSGLPFGRYPRLFIAWLVTEAVRTKSPHVTLGSSMARFMEQLGVPCSGGKTGTAPRVRDQMKRVLSTSFSFTHEGEDHHAGVGMRVAKKHMVWWDPLHPEDMPLFEESFVTLSGDFFEEIVDRPVPIDLRVLQYLQSPLAIDLYGYLTYRMFSLRRTMTVPWTALHGQFGTQAARARDFKREIRRALVQVLEVYREARVEVGKDGLVLSPSPTHVPRRLSA